MMFLRRKNSFIGGDSLTIMSMTKNFIEETEYCPYCNNRNKHELVSGAVTLFKLLEQKDNLIKFQLRYDANAFTIVSLDINTDSLVIHDHTGSNLVSDAFNNSYLNLMARCEITGHRYFAYSSSLITSVGPNIKILGPINLEVEDLIYKDINWVYSKSHNVMELFSIYGKLLSSMPNVNFSMLKGNIDKYLVLV